MPTVKCFTHMDPNALLLICRLFGSLFMVLFSRKKNCRPFVFQKKKIKYCQPFVFQKKKKILYLNFFFQENKKIK